MNERGKSDGLVVPAKPPNNAGVPAAEAVEGRGPAKGNAASKTRPGHSAGLGVTSALDRVRRAAQKDKEARFTALLHHVDLERLRAGTDRARDGRVHFCSLSVPWGRIRTVRRARGRRGIGRT